MIHQLLRKIGILSIFLLILPHEIYAKGTSSPALGINLAGPCDWNTELPFVDLMCFSRAFASQRHGMSYGKGPPLSLDTAGYPTSLPSDGWAETALISWGGHPWPVGVYTIHYEGKGKLDFGKSECRILENTPGFLKVELKLKEANLHMSILETDPSDHLRNIHVILPGFEETWRSNPWHPLFLKRWKKVACLRFMDFMGTNNSKIVKWAQRPRIGDSTFAGRGVPLELLIDLCNRNHIDPWFCMPAQAEDDYIRNFAVMVHEKLDPSLKIHLEYSNEVWNSGFSQYKYASEKGQVLGLSKNYAEAVWLYTARRSMETFTIFESVFGGSSRLVRILPAQFGNPYMARKILEFEGASHHADAIAIAPYVDFCVPQKGTKNTAGEVATWSLDQLFSHLQENVLPVVQKKIKAYQDLSHEYGLDLVAYEGGQHLVGIAGGENDRPLTDLFLAANGDRRMGTIYSTLLNSWTQSGGSLFCHFSSIAQWDKWGSWGLMQYWDDNPESSPKFQAVQSWGISCK